MDHEHLVNKKGIEDLIKTSREGSELCSIRINWIGREIINPRLVKASLDSIASSELINCWHGVGTKGGTLRLK